MTFQDRNPVKRYLQRSRLKDAVRLCRLQPGVKIIVDYGAGNGELCKHLSDVFPEAKIYCFEPHPELLEQARENLKNVANVIFIDRPLELADASVDIVFCLEVFEHLPEKELRQALGHLDRILAVDGVAVIGVPVETGLPALYKGVFRMLRRFGEFDAQFKHIVPAIFSRPPSRRPEVEIMPGVKYYLHHLGFDHRKFRDRVSSNFEELKVSASPFPRFGFLINSEANILVRKNPVVDEDEKPTSLP